MFPVLKGVVTYPSKTADGEKGRPLVLPLLLYSLVELFFISVYHAYKNPPGSVLNIGRLKAHARSLKNPLPIFDFLNCQVYIFLVFVMNRYIGIQNPHP